MKRIIVLSMVCILASYSYGQIGDNFDSSDIDWRSFFPPKFDPSRYNTYDCGIPTFDNTYTYMDTFRVLFRKPFGPYLLGGFYEGYIQYVDSVTQTTPFIGIENDSIVYLYASFNVIMKYESPYNQNIHFSPIPEDIIHDSINDFLYYHSLRNRLYDTLEQQKKVCVMVTKQEIETILFSNASASPPKILLRTTSDNEEDSLGVIFCFQPFWENYSTDALMTQKMIAKYKLFRYKELYYNIFNRRFVDKDRQ